MVQQENKRIIQEKNVAFKNYRNNSGIIDLKCRLKYLQTYLNASIEVAKEKYCHNTVNKLMNTQENYKSYWSLLKIFLNNMKIPIIPPLFYKNRFITDFKEKVQHFNIFFSEQCFLIPNISSLLADVNCITDKRLSTVTFSARGIRKTIQNLDSNKAHRHDNMKYSHAKNMW